MEEESYAKKSLGTACIFFKISLRKIVTLDVVIYQRYIVQLHRLDALFRAQRAFPPAVRPGLPGLVVNLELAGSVPVGRSYFEGSRRCTKQLAIRLTVEKAVCLRDTYVS